MTDLLPTAILTGEQLRAARAMLRLDQKQFAALAHVTVGVIRRMERSRGPIIAAPELLEAIRIAIDEAGIEFIQPGHFEGVGGPGLRMKAELVVANDIVDIHTASEELALKDKLAPEAS